MIAANAATTTLDSVTAMHVEELLEKSGRSLTMYTISMLVTPALAKAMLVRNRVNRPIDRRHLAKLKWALRNRCFKHMPQCVTFNRQAWMVDGQHRCTAICETGIAAMLRVTFDYDGDVHDPFDNGRTRTVADTVHRSTLSVATCGALALLSDGDAVVGAEQNKRIYDQHKEGVDWAVKSASGRRGVTAGVLAALAFAYPTDRTSVTEFTDQFVNFLGVTSSAPSVTFRRYLEHAPSKGTAGQLRVMYATLSALRAHGERKATPRQRVDDMGFRYFAQRRARLGV